MFAIFISFIFVNLLLIERKIEFYYSTSRFNDAILEARRFEKNYLLYSDINDINRSLSFVALAQEITNIEIKFYDQSWMFKISEQWLRPFEEVSAQQDYQRINRQKTLQLLDEYEKLLTHIQSEPDQAKAKQSAIRVKGQMLTEIAEQLNKNEIKHVQALFKIFKWILVFLVLMLFIATIVIAKFIVQSVTNPLRSLEESMNRITSGDFAMLPILPTQDDEIRSLHQAFNRMFRELFEHRRELVRSEKLASLGTMLAGVAHEINNPLSNISTSAEILHEKMAGSNHELKNRLIQQVISETDRTRDIIRTVLEFSREQCSTKCPIDLISTIQDALLLIRGKLGTTLVDIQIDEGHRVYANKQQLQQVFINLLKNAADAMEWAVEEKRVTISSQDLGNGFLEIIVADTGPGLSPDSFSNIFDPFYTTKEPGKGTGLGLFVIHEIIKEHGGNIRVESLPDQGATFKIKLPIGDEQRG